MKHPKIITLLMLGALAIPMSLGAQSNKDMKAIKAVVKQYQDALNNNSLDGVMAVFDDDAVVLPDDGPAAAGHAAIRESYEPITSASMSVQITLEIQELIATDDVAYVWSLNYGTIKFKDQNEGDIDSKSLMVLRKTMDGWKVHRYMFNSNNAAD
jgi:uncharacterized protein (TIGR02246 family)